MDLSKKEKNGNFKLNQYNEKYGFNLEETLRKFPIKELNDQIKTKWMLKSLRKGNTYPVEVERNGKSEIMFVEASPKFKSINVYDASMSLVKNADRLIDGKKQGKGKEPEPEQSKKKKT